MPRSILPATWRTLVLTVIALHASVLAAQVPRADLLVSSRGTHSVKRLNGTTGASLGDFIAPGAGGLNTTQEIRMGPDQRIYVSGRGNTAILRFDQNSGAFIDRFTKGYALDQPTKMTFLEDGNLYVSQWGTTKSSVAVFDGTTGQFLREATPNLGQPMQHLRRANGELLVARFQGGAGDVRRISASGADLGPFTTGKALQGPVNIWYHESGDVLVMDWTAGTIERFNATTGAFLSTFASGLANPEGAVLGPDGSLYVAEWTANRVARLNATTGARLGTLGGSSGLQNPNSLLFAPGLADFTLGLADDEVTVAPGGIAEVQVALSPLGSGALTGPVQLGCGSLPAGWTCEFLPSSVSLSTSPSQARLLVHTAQPLAAVALWPMLLIGAVSAARYRRVRSALLLSVMAVAAACGKGPVVPRDDEPVPVTVVVEARSGALLHTASFEVLVSP